MSTDKTLATVKHGGRVRLGDQLPPLPNPWYRPSSSNAPFDLDLYSEGQMWEYARAALSAQPSPGGQGDASHYWPEVDRILVDAYVAGSEGDEFDMIAARNAIHAALAARQPVGAYEVQTENGPLKCSLAVYAEWQKNEEYIARLESELKAARQPVGDEERAETYRKGWEAGHTAQAVDQAAFKALYQAYVRLLESGRDRIIDLGGTCDPVDVMEANDVDLQAARRVLDSQAVRNG